MSTRPPSNFDFLAHHDPRLVVLGAEAERQFAEFPVACIGTLRRFGEILAQRAAAKVGVLVDTKAAQVDVLGRLAARGALPSAGGAPGWPSSRSHRLGAPGLQARR